MEEGEFHKQMGRVAVAMTRSDNYCQYPVACLAVWIKPAILLEQIHYFYDELGSLAGYMTWAFLAPDVECRLVNDPDVLFHISEWNEGDRLWIMDFVVFKGNVRRYIKQARALFPGIQTVNWLRRDDEGLVKKIMKWNGRPPVRARAGAIT